MSMKAPKKINCKVTTINGLSLLKNVALFRPIVGTDLIEFVNENEQVLCAIKADLIERIDYV